MLELNSCLLRKIGGWRRSNSGERLKFKLSFAVVVACCLVAGASAQSVTRPLHRKQPLQKDAPVTSAPEPVTPLSPEQMPASPPQVAFSSGMLTITANNSTLGDILRAVHRQTGAAVDVPGNATERVVGRFGPGPVRDVMTLLLNGSHFNYVVMGSATDPNRLERVVLISRASGMEQAGQPNAATAQYQAPMAVPQTVENADTSNDDSADMPQESTDAADEANQSQPEEQQQPANPFGQRGNVKTPEQLLQELQQRQQQMQQQQQQAAPQSFPPAPMGVPQPQPSQPQ